MAGGTTDWMVTPRRPALVIRLPIPCQLLTAGFGASKFEPGARFCSENGAPTAVARIPEADRLHGLRRLLFGPYRPRRHRIEFLVDGRRELSLSLRYGWFVRQRALLHDGKGAAIGSMELVTSAMRQPTFEDRVVVRDANDREFGRFEFRSDLTQVSLRLVDVHAGHAYSIARSAGPDGDAAHGGIRLRWPGPYVISGDGNVRDIDARLLLAMAYYLDFAGNLD